MGADDAALDEARDALEAACGSEGLVDTAAVVANFQRMVRIADSTGIPLDNGMTAFTAGIREELGINGYASASNTPQSEGWRQTAGQFAGVAVHGIFKTVGFVRRIAGHVC